MRGCLVVISCFFCCDFLFFLLWFLDFFVVISWLLCCNFLVFCCNFLTSLLTSLLHFQCCTAGGCSESPLIPSCRCLETEGWCLRVVRSSNGSRVVNVYVAIDLLTSEAADACEFSSRNARCNRKQHCSCMDGWSMESVVPLNAVPWAAYERPQRILRFDKQLQPLRWFEGDSEWLSVDEIGFL